MALFGQSACIGLFRVPLFVVGDDRVLLKTSECFKAECFKAAVRSLGNGRDRLPICVESGTCFV